MKFLNEKYRTIVSKNNIVIFSSIFVLLCIIAIIAFGGKTNSKDVIIDSNIYKLSYSGGSLDGNMHGLGTLSDSNGMLKIRGDFKNNNFINGTLVVKSNNKKITMTGEFEDYVVTSGEMIVVEDDIIVFKKGTFNNGKLNGSGFITVTKDGQETYSYSGVFVEDLPKF